MTIKKIMTTEVLTLKPLDSFITVQKIMRSVTFHHLLVADNNNQLLGVISDRDLMGQVSKYIDNKNEDTFSNFLPKLKAMDIMTKNVISIDRDTPIDAASVLLLENNFSCLPIVNEFNEIEGIVTWKDLLKYYIYN